MATLREILKQVFGHSEFRQGQEELINSLLSGRDVLGIMPTGAGKSVCYQLPSLIFKGMTIVISPLISLMKDQVTTLRQSGFSAAYLNSSLTASQQSEVLRRARLGAYRLMYVSPERLETKGFLELLQAIEISFIAVDESHCVSQWGQDFRPDYLKIASFIESLPVRPVIGAFTATATSQVKDDIIKLLNLRDPLLVTTGFDRPNLSFSVIKPRNKLSQLKNFLSDKRELSGIIYCTSRSKVEDVANELCDSGFSAAPYHAGLNDEVRKRNQEDFVYDRIRIMVATNAFGMGIDKSNVSFVVHYNMPKDIESYYQEAGRAGRDGAPAECLLLFSHSDIAIIKHFIFKDSKNEMLSELDKAINRKRSEERLQKMIEYCKTEECLRRYLLRYFGENPPAQCNNCGNCNAKLYTQNITAEAVKILNAVNEIENECPFDVGVTLVIHTLTGSKDANLLALRLDTLSCYGSMRRANRAALRKYIGALIDQDYLRQTKGAKPTIFCTGKAGSVIDGNTSVSYTRRIEDKDETKKTSPSVTAKKDLLEILKGLRQRVALQESVPAFMVFTNSTLIDMANKQPETLSEFLEVSGVGSVKAQKYAGTFLNAIRLWKNK